MRVGVLGAGLSGSLVALQLADAGHDVALVDRQQEALAGASGTNEGKIHLGYVYAADRSGRTARAMARAAATFRPLLERWISRDNFDRALSAPFVYAVPRGSLVSPDDIRGHFEQVSTAVREVGNSTPAPECVGRWREIAAREYGEMFDQRRVECVFATEERAVRPDCIAGGLKSALRAQRRITQMFGHQVESASRDRSSFIVTGTAAGRAFSERFDVVVNALWEHRLRIDADIGHPPGRAVVHRFKHGLWSDSARIARSIPSVTFIVGTYGDCVAFSDAAYASWYPAGLALQEVGLSPSRQDLFLDADERELLVSKTLDALSRLMPGAADAFTADRGSWQPRGGFITAWGRTGIDDARSELHQRHEVGVHSDGDWHSIDTGKLTMAPMFAASACARIVERHGATR
jgi:hypothetical protein